MIGRDESHLLREREVEKEDTTMRAITRLIVDVSIRAHASPGMSAVYFLKLLIHRRRYENGNLGKFATKRHRRHKRIDLTPNAFANTTSSLCLLCLFVAVFVL